MGKKVLKKIKRNNPTEEGGPRILNIEAIQSAAPLSDRQLENLRAVFGRGVKKRNGRRLAGKPANFVNTLTGEFWVSLRMVW